MNKLFPVVVLTTILLQTSLAQTNTYQISSFPETSQAFKYLLLPNLEISKNDTVNEEILDLVEPMLLDSVLHRRTEHHHVFLVGWFIHAFGGYNWRAVDRHKQKFVGTITNDSRSGSVEFTEYDIKYHLHFHLQKYLFKDFSAYDLQRKYHRQDIRPSHHTNYKLPPFVRDTNNIDSRQYDLGCELTPAIPFIPQLNNLFFPTLPGAGGPKDHPNFDSQHPSMGFYGAYCLDCNHNCHPEMHPYEWTWWLNLKDESSTDKTWLIGLFHEGSNRFPKWSKSPMTGEIKIPFAYDISHGQVIHPAIKIDHLVFDKFLNKELEKLNLPSTTLDAKTLNRDVEFVAGDSTSILCKIMFNEQLLTNGLKYWFTELNLDKKNNMLTGYFHFATSVEQLYTTRITFTTYK